MPPQTSRSPVRLLAPIALVACVFALGVVVVGSNVTGGGDGQPESATDDSPPPSADATEPEEPAAPKKQKRSYTVELGDSLGAISEKTGVEVETIQLLNPELDPQSLTVGQKIKLRE